MVDQITRVARPVSGVEVSGVTTPRGLNRNNLMLALTFIGLFAGGAGAGVTAYKWYAAEQQNKLTETRMFDTQSGKFKNETAAMQTDAEVSRIMKETNANRASHPKLAAEIDKLHNNLLYTTPAGALPLYEDLAFAQFAKLWAYDPVERRKMAAEGNAATAAQQKNYQETRSAKKQGDLNEGVITPALVDALGRAASGAVTGGDPLGIRNPRSSIPPIGGARSSQSLRDEYKNPDTTSQAARDELKNNGQIK